MGAAKVSLGLLYYGVERDDEKVQLPYLVDERNLCERDIEHSRRQHGNMGVSEATTGYQSSP
jgi:hypothetical protein